MNTYNDKLINECDDVEINISKELLTEIKEIKTHTRLIYWIMIIFIILWIILIIRVIIKTIFKI